MSEEQNPYKVEFTKQTRDRLINGDTITFELDNYLTITVMSAKTKLYSIPELIRKLEKLQLFNDPRYEEPEPDWANLKIEETND